MPRKAKPPTDRAAEQEAYAAWKAEGVAGLANRREVRAGIIPERLWRHLYIQGRYSAGGRPTRRCPPTTGSLRVMKGFGD
jgi:hypothetical protein